MDQFEYNNSALYYRKEDFPKALRTESSHVPEFLQKPNRTGRQERTRNVVSQSMTFQEAQLFPNHDKPPGAKRLKNTKIPPFNIRQINEDSRAEMRIPSYNEKDAVQRFYMNKLLQEKDIKLHNMDSKRKWNHMNETL